MLGKQARCHQWAFLLGVVLISIGFAPSVHADEFFDKVCTDTVNCTSYAGARCLQTNVTGVLKCGCETSSGAKMTGNICRIDVELGQKCNGVFAFCKQANSECVHAGGMNSEYRCKCQQDYVAVKNDNGTLQCVANKLNMSNAAFAGFLAGVIIILLLLMVVSAIILVRMRKQGGQESDKVTMTDRPQRFALPRNNHLRI